MNEMTNGHELQSAAKAGHFFSGHDELQRLIEVAAAISFDFFDTLFTRPLANPEDAFDILAIRFAIPDFRERRLAAQAEAFRRMHAAGRKEIRLEDIYTCLAETGLPSDELMRAEYALELALVEPNPEMFAVFHALLAAGKPVVITSDMYFSTEFFIEALQPHGLAHVPLFISADCNATKRDSGELFSIVAARLGLPTGNILHIGDNQLADVMRPREKGLMVFHYRASWDRDVKKTASLSTSIGHGLLRTSTREITPDSYTELGFIYGGPATVGFLQWIRERARLDGIDHVLFLSRDGYALERVARAQADSGLPDFCYFLGSRTAYTLAAIKAENFSQFLPFLLSGADGLAPCELLERIGVQPPAPKIMADLGLGDKVRVTPALHEKMASFLYAYRWEILKVCQRNRHALYRYLKQVGITAGNRVALVDVGWSGTTQEAFELAVRPLMDLQVFGYYFCLADTLERIQREQKQRMAAMVSAATTSVATISSIYANRVTVELFFSAPHHSVIGLQVGQNGVEPVLDAGRGNTSDLLRIAQEVGQGVEAFSEHYCALQQRLDFRASPLQIAWPLIGLVTEKQGHPHPLLAQVKNFDAWGSSRNHELTLASYLSASA
ncbi:Haloacid dehalogenase domain protein hydrolase [Nitrosomonas sp. Is79A3]|uniref:haloacid dehalogenase n=1 Tax=Nitrosomonas sp. (strain Is79A3) TaxID=261292 RepID=UPI000215C72C